MLCVSQSPLFGFPANGKHKTYPASSLESEKIYATTHHTICWYIIKALHSGNQMHSFSSQPSATMLARPFNLFSLKLHHKNTIFKIGRHFSYRFLLTTSTWKINSLVLILFARLVISSWKGYIMQDTRNPETRKMHQLTLQLQHHSSILAMMLPHKLHLINFLNYFNVQFLQKRRKAV